MNVAATPGSRTADRASAQAFLKWAGGKRQLLPEIRRFYPLEITRYWEPFLGSGAVFFDLVSQGRLDGATVFLLDTSADLIGCYHAIRDDVQGVIAALGTLQKRHADADRQTYYEVRRRFNALRREAQGPEHAIELAAMLIYLNRTGFNGLFRLNARGGFNVPIGRYVSPRICDAANLRRVSAVLNRPDVHVRRGSYELLAAQASAGDFVYLDPPYAPLSATASFRSYTAEGFSSDDQRRLQRITIALAKRGCLVLLSNSSAPEIERLYGGSAAARRAGLRVLRVKARRAINSKGAARGTIDELLVTNA